MLGDFPQASDQMWGVDGQKGHLRLQVSAGVIGQTGQGYYVHTGV